MKVYDAPSLRNVALVGHSGAGKTQLISTLLFDAGAVNRLGRVDDGTTVTDYDEEEIARKHTLSAALAYAEWNKTKINLIDTPGMANFLSDARAALRVVDAAIVVVDAVSGVEVSTEKVWAAAEELQLPRIVVLNRLDRERASLDRSLESLRGVFGRAVIPIQLPIGEEKAFNPRLRVKSPEEYVDLMSSLQLPSPKMMDVAVPANMHLGLAQDEIAQRGWAVTPLGAIDLIGRSEVAFVDLRERSELERNGEIPGALHAPYPALQENLSRGGILRELAGTKRIVFYCAFGERSGVEEAASLFS